MKEKVIPLIKEYRIQKLFEVLDCFEGYPFNRDSLRECILQLYKGKEEKSVFRGMVIPSLRHLGLILGYDEDLRLSANGNLIVIAQKKSEKDGLRVFRAILTEIDDVDIKILKIIAKERIAFECLKQRLIEEIDAPSEKQARERINHWVSMLLDTGLLVKKNEKIDIARKILSQGEKDLDISTKKDKFEKVFFEAYKSIFKKQGNIPIIDIPDIRAEVATMFYTRRNLIVTEGQFDELLRGVKFATDDYIISLGRAMGAEEKLFKHEDNYYRTVSIRFLNKEGKT
jgi:sugar-specific transcriptional regulator TrmB